jgi:superfamily II DNA or RNA helicase
MTLRLRPYQEEAVARFVERIDQVERGGLIVLPTGTGKSCVMAEIAKWWLEHRPGGVGIISHRVELMRQNATEFENLTGITCYREQGHEHRIRESDWDRVRLGGVVSFTVQTLQNRRMQRVSRDSIGLLLVDECHRIRDAGQYCKVQEYFGAKWVGLTATPDRTDSQPLIGTMFDECWYDGKIDDFVEQGWLVPPRVQHVHVSSLQWQWLKKRSGKDFTAEQVGKVWQDKRAIYEFVQPILKEVGQRKTLYFCPGVPQAHDVAAVINGLAHPRRVAEYVASYQIDGDNNRSEYPKQKRRQILKKFGRVEDELQHVANMGVFTEGTNVPVIGAIGWLRFTKSRLLLAQGAGRAFRTWPGTLDGLEHATAAQRREAIAKSPKPFALFFDPAKVTGRLKLVHVIDLFGVGKTPAVQRRVAEIVRKKAERGEPVDPREVLAEAAELESPFFKGLKAALLEIAPQVDYRLVEVDPFAGGTKSANSLAGPKPKKGGDASYKQKRLIEMLAPVPYSPEFMSGLGRGQAGAIIDGLMKAPCVAWIRKKLPGQNPKTNKEGMSLLKQKQGGN